MLVEGDPLVLVDEEGGVAVTQGHVDDLPQRGGGVLPDVGRHTPDVDLLHLEELAWGRQEGIRLGDGHGRGVLVASDAAGTAAVGGGHVVSLPLVGTWSKTAAR